MVGGFRHGLGPGVVSKLTPAAVNDFLPPTCTPFPLAVDFSPLLFVPPWFPSFPVMSFQHPQWSRRPQVENFSLGFSGGRVLFCFFVRLFDHFF